MRFWKQKISTKATKILKEQAEIVEIKCMESIPIMNSQKYNVTQEWIENLKNESDNDGTSFDGEGSIVESDTDDDSDIDVPSTKMALGTPTPMTEILDITDGVKELFNTLNSVQTVGNVNIENSTGVHIGNITNINGNIQIIHNGKRRKNVRESRKSKSPTHEEEVDPKLEEHEERVSADAFISRNKFKIPRQVFLILPRSSWLAQCPMEKHTYLKEPVDFVVISHTATESSEKQAKNIGIVRDIQCFHIETRGWNDIAYNFLIGCDGNIYEGRGWGVVGAHTIGYNTLSIGITFIGCFMLELPSQMALTACQNLLKKGVDQGHLSKDYKLISHTQCRSTESPGRKLYEELQTWEHFYKIEDEEEQ